MKPLLKQAPIYLLLLAVFFVLHGFSENYNYIPLSDAFTLMGVYLLACIILAGLFWIFTRNISKASALAFLCMFFFFFFGYLYDTINSLSPNSFFGKYTVLTGSFFFLLLIVFIALVRYKRPLSKLNYALNVFFICLLLVEFFGLAFKILSFQPAYTAGKQENIVTCDTCSKPDVFLIVTDAYGGEKQLKETMNFSNDFFYNALRSRGFHVPHSSSNYNYTPFSCASMLQMEYVQDLEKSNTSHKDLQYCYEILDRNKVAQILQLHGYSFHNYSIFDMWGQPSIVKQTILPERTKFITAQTLFSRLYTNAIFNMAGKFAFLRNTRLYYSLKSNIRALDSTRNIISRKTDKPKFVYTHLLMPHYPYYFDENGVERKPEEIYDGKELDIPKYLSYMKYTNGILLSLIDTMMTRSSKPPIIIIIADHGFREYPNPVSESYQFNNLFAVHLPSKNYASFYNGISNVNVFRMLLNQQFNQKFRLLKDSTVWINP